MVSGYLGLSDLPFRHAWELLMLPGRVMGLLLIPPFCLQAGLTGVCDVSSGACGGVGRTREDAAGG